MNVAEKNYCLFVAYSPKLWYKFNNVDENLIKILIILFIYTLLYIYYFILIVHYIVNLKLLMKQIHFKIYYKKTFLSGPN